MISKVDFLASLFIFEDFDEDQLEDLAQIADEFEFEENAVIAYQRDVAVGLYIVVSGRLVASSLDEQGIVRASQSYNPGEYFDDTWLFVPALHPSTVKAASAGRIIIISEPNFLRFLEQHPYALEELNLSEAAADAAERSRLVLPKKQYTAMGLMPDELIELETRRSQWRLVLRIIWPTLGLLIVPALFYVLLNYFGDTGVWHFILPILPALIFAFFLGFQILDWANDYFIITTRHIIHYEFDLRTFGISLQKTPLDQIQSVEIVRENLIQTLLDIGTVRVTTAARDAVVFFDDVDNPEIIRDTLQRLRERVKALDASRFRASMRSSLESYFQAPPPYRKVTRPEAADNELLPERASWFGRVGPIITGILATGRPKPAAGNVAIYHRHWIVLVFRTWKAGLVSLGLSLVSLLALFWLQYTSVFVIVGVAAFIASLYFFWQVEDWRNDLYQVTDRYVIDIDRKPLGFGESRKQAELGNVQNIKAKKEGLIATVFNFGFVHIETAGAQADIVFEYVKNPNLVQAEIFKRREQFRQQQRALDEQRRRQEYAVLLDVFQEAREQNRIPPRTAGFDEQA
jgi:CRP-like cAMP-binding protein